MHAALTHVTTMATVLAIVRLTSNVIVVDDIQD